MDCTLKEEQFSIIYNVSFLSLGTSIYAWTNRHFTLAICPGSVFLTSINYWRKPDSSWRRYLDMCVVKCALSYQLYMAYGSPRMWQYYTLTGIGVGFYSLGVYYDKKNLHWHSTYAHCLLHVFANIANVVLYSGYPIAK
jgi:hypothetical protein